MSHTERRIKKMEDTKKQISEITEKLIQSDEKFDIIKILNIKKQAR